ncbi:PLP-dependent aminotransferase family protein [Microbaculum marinum]|uniref:PLP-dependent aminotransferase family protein n=1 Tax=Microbaculum marinum TaxID=1764581 RepID=A0AAW9RNT4_9HYPH
MSIWPPKKDMLKRPAYRSLAQCIVAAIEAGEIRPGARLPTHRALAYQLGLSVQTVSRAYEDLSRLGVISGEVGRGSFVKAGRPDGRVPWHRLAGGEEVIDCSLMVPVTGAIHSERMSAALVDLSTDLPEPAILSFRPRATLEGHCELARGWLSTCGVDVDRNCILPTNGNTAAMTIALMTAALPGDLIVSEATGHHTLKSLANALGMRLSGLAIDAEGIIPEAFESACRSETVKVLFVLPSGLSPTAAMMSTERRQALADIARRHRVWIVENDAWGPIQPDRPPPFAAIAPERTFYFTGLTKCLLPGLRIAWLVSPEMMVSAARTRHLVTNWMATPLIAEIASRWLENGTAEELLSWQREQLERRNRIAAQMLGGLRYNATAYGLHVWLPLPEPWREDAFVTHARNDGVAVAAGSNFAISESYEPAIRICLGAGTEQDLEQGLAVIARLVRSTPEPALLAI